MHISELFTKDSNIVRVSTRVGFSHRVVGRWNNLDK